MEALVTHALFVGDLEQRLEEVGISNIASADSVCHKSKRIRLANPSASWLDEAGAG